MDRDSQIRWIRTDTVLLAAGLLLLAWLLGGVLLLVFAAILIAVGLDGLAVELARRTSLSRGWSLVVVTVALAALLAGLGGLTMPQFIQQLGELRESLAGFVEDAREYFATTEVEVEQLLGDMEANGQEMMGTAEDILAQAAAWGMTTLGALSSLVVLIVLAMFLAADPALYREGFLRLLPPARRELADTTLSAVAYALRWWFLGQLASMLLLGVTVGLGLFIIGIELWLALAVLTALLTFIPFLGPLIAAVPIIVVGFAEGVETGLIVMAGYLVIQNLEGNVVVPMIQHKAVNLAPALLISLQVLLSVAFGVMGLMLAAPLTVVGMVAVKKLYIEAVLGDHEGGKV
jgi:predicted PurR-regulated permease PerM